MSRVLIRAVAVGAVLALAVAACGGTPARQTKAETDAAAPAPADEDTVDDPELVIEGEAPTPETLAGIWSNETPGWEDVLVYFGADGTFVGSRSGNFGKDGADATGYRPVIVASYEIDGRTVTVTFREDSCAPKGSTFAWETGVPEDGRLHNVWLAVPGGSCPPYVGLEFRWVRVSPSSPASAGITAEVSSEDGRPPTDAREFFGIWLLEGTGYLVRFDSDGTYLLADDGRLLTDPDRGTVEVDEEGRLTLTSGKDSRTCSKGHAWVWRDVRILSGQGALRGAGGRDDCGRHLGPDLTWVRLSP